MLECICLLPLNALRNYASVYACMFGIPIMHHVKLLISALISFVYVHGAFFPCLVCWFHPLRWSKGWGRDRVVSDLEVATMGLYGPRRSN